MSEYNFEPDFQKWWGKNSLSNEDLSILVFGLNPDQFKRYLDVGNRERNDEERNFLNSYHDYVSAQKQHNDIYRINDLRLMLLKEGYLSKGKKNFIEYVYENGFAYLGEEISEKLVSYLSSIGEMPTHFDKYKDFSKYRADISTIKDENIKTEDEAFAYLLGLAPEYFYKFQEYTDDRRIKKKKWEDIAPENKFFARRYFIFIREEYGFLDMFGEETLFKAYRQAKSLNIWDGSLAKYVQSLHDEGFIFRSDIYEKLKMKGIKPVYSENSWVEQFYKRWIKEALWTLDESMALFKGQNPKKGRSFHDLSQNPWMFSNNLFWENFDNEFLPIDERLKKHIAAGLLNPEKIDGKDYFYPSEIVRWMAENFTYSPPEAILTFFSSDEEKSKPFVRSAKNDKVFSIRQQREREISELKTLLEKKGYSFLEPIPFKHQEIADYLLTKKPFRYMDKSSIITHYIKTQGWDFKRGASSKNQPTLLSVIGTK